MATEKRLIDANAFNIGLAVRDFDFFVKKQIKPWRKTSTADVGYSVATIADVLDMTPTVDAVEVVHGRWINRTKVIYGQEDVCFRCSHCGTDYYYDAPERYNYCPNCGADMR